MEEIENLQILGFENMSIAELMTKAPPPRDADDHLLVKEAENLTIKVNAETRGKKKIYELSDQVFPLSNFEALRKLEYLDDLIKKTLKKSSKKLKIIPNRSNKFCMFSENTSRIVRLVDTLSVDMGLKGLSYPNRLLLSSIIEQLMSNLYQLEEGQSHMPLFLRTLYYIVYNKRSPDDDEAPKITPEKVTKYVDSLCCFFRCSRKSLGVMACDTDSSFVGSVIVIREDIDSKGKPFTDDGLALNQPYRINYDNIKYVLPKYVLPSEKPKFILVVEKMTVFNGLCSSRFHRRSPCVIITGGGQPTIECRLFLKMVQKSLEVPVFVLVDCNPFGIEIFKSYKYGSVNMAFMSRDLVVPSVHIRMIGLFHSDLVKHDIMETDMVLLQKLDIEKATALLKEEWMPLEPLISKSLESSLATKTKADLEILVRNIGYTRWIDDYLLVRIHSNLEELGGTTSAKEENV